MWGGTDSGGPPLRARAKADTFGDRATLPVQACVAPSDTMGGYSGGRLAGMAACRHLR
jgi:hypothetical protein